MKSAESGSGHPNLILLIRVQLETRRVSSFIHEVDFTRRKTDFTRQRRISYIVKEVTRHE